MPVKGIERTKRGFKVKIEEIDGQRTNRAMHAILSRGAAMSATMTPVDTSKLINSQYTRVTQQQGKATGRTGYTARYAEAVHDASGKLKGQPRADFGRTRAGVEFGGGTGNGNYWDPNAEPKFLEKGFEEIKPEIPAILKAAYHE